MIEAPKIIESRAVYAQIGEHVRELIVSGKLAPDTKLPSTEQLAQQWRTAPKTIQNALAPLVKEGLLVRMPKRGTLVRQREAKLTCVGLYEVGSLDGDGGSPFQRAMLAELRRQLLAANIEPDVWVDSRPETERHQPWQPLVREIQQRHMQAVIMPCAGWAQYHWVSKLPVPSAFFGSARRPNVVHLDLVRMAELCVHALAEQGCRSLGIISGYPHDEPAEPAGGHDFAEYHRHLHAVATARGLRMDDTWIREQRIEGVATRLSQERFGYEQFHALWDLPQRPEGLIVDMDTISQGAVKALLERQVRVPAELKLVMAKNAHVDLLCPLPAALCVHDETALARALIEQVQKQFRGERCVAVRIAPTLTR